MAGNSGRLGSSVLRGGCYSTRADTCPVCGKAFEHAHHALYAYKRTIRGKLRCMCSYACMRAYDKANERADEEKARASHIKAIEKEKRIKTRQLLRERAFLPRAQANWEAAKAAVLSLGADANADQRDAAMARRRKRGTTVKNTEARIEKLEKEVRELDKTLHTYGIAGATDAL